MPALPAPWGTSAGSHHSPICRRRLRWSHWTKKAKALNDAGVKVREQRARSRQSLKTPQDLTAALKKNKKASVVFQSFSPTKKRDYIEWITEAKNDDTRAKRLTTAIGWIAQGKSRNWKYEKRS